MDSKEISSLKTTIDYNNSRNIPKTISYFFLISQLIIGCEFGFTKLFDENVKRLLRIITISQVFVYNIIFLTPLITFYPPLTTVSLNLMPFFEYTLNGIILFCYKKYSIYDFLFNISEFCKLTNTDAYILSLITVIHFTVAYILKISLLFMIKGFDLKAELYFDQLPSLHCLLLSLYYMIIDLVAIAQIVMFYYVYNSMKHLKAVLTSSDQKLNFISKRYKAIVNTYERIRPLSDFLMVLELFFGVPKILGTLWCFLYYIKADAEWILYVYQLIFTCHTTLCIMARAILAEMARAQVDSMKLYLHDILLVESDVIKSDEVTKFLRYLDARRINYYVYRNVIFIPVDIGLVLSLFSLCTTYFIVILQFTHLVD